MLTGDEPSDSGARETGTGHAGGRLAAVPRDADSVRSVAEAPRGPHATSLLLSVTRGAPSDDVGVRPRLLLQAPPPAPCKSRTWGRRRRFWRGDLSHTPHTPVTHPRCSPEFPAHARAYNESGEPVSSKRRDLIYN